MKLLLIRHAESVRNVNRKGKVFYDVGQEKIGLPNHLIPITKKGEGQAVEVAKKLYRDWKTGKQSLPVLLIHSGFVRTKDTCDIVYSHLKKYVATDGVTFDIPTEQNHLIRERDAGHTFEMDEVEAMTHFPHLSDYWKLDGKWFAVPIGGESLVHVMDRVSLFLSQLVHDERLKDATVYAFTHGGTMQAFEMVITKKPFDGESLKITTPENCEYICYEYAHGRWSVSK